MIVTPDKELQILSSNVYLTMQGHMLIKNCTLQPVASVFLPQPALKVSVTEHLLARCDGRR